MQTCYDDGRGLRKALRAHRWRSRKRRRSEGAGHIYGAGMGFILEGGRRRREWRLCLCPPTVTPASVRPLPANRAADLAPFGPSKFGPPSHRPRPAPSALPKSLIRRLRSTPPVLPASAAPPPSCMVRIPVCIQCMSLLFPAPCVFETACRIPPPSSPITSCHRLPNKMNKKHVRFKRPAALPVRTDAPDLLKCGK